MYIYMIFQIISTIDNHLLQSPALGDECAVAECLRGLFVLPLCHVFLAFEEHLQLICRYASRIMKLNSAMSKIIGMMINS